jgi:hypothetical protein
MAQKKRKSARKAAVVRLPTDQNVGRRTQNGSNKNLSGLAICEQICQGFSPESLFVLFKKKFGYLLA